MIGSSSFLMPSWHTGVSPATISFRGGRAQPMRGPEGPIDSSVLSQSGPLSNPFQEVAPGCAKVAVEPWGKSGANSSLTQILRNQGYSDREIFTPDANGVTLIDRVASANGLRNPNLIHPGQELRVPSPAPNEAPLAPTAQGPAAPDRFCPVPRNGGSATPERPPSPFDEVGEAIGLANDVEGASEELRGPRGSRPNGPRPPRLLRVANGVLTVFETASEINDIRRDNQGRKAERTVETIGRGVGESVGSWLLGTEGMIAGATAGFVVGGPVGFLVGGLLGAVAGGAVGKWIGGAIGGGMGRLIGNTPVGRVIGQGVLDTYDRVLGPLERFQETARSLDASGSAGPGPRISLPNWPRLAYT